MPWCKAVPQGQQQKQARSCLPRPNPSHPAKSFSYSDLSGFCPLPLVPEASSKLESRALIHPISGRNIRDSVGNTVSQMQQATMKCGFQKLMICKVFCRFGQGTGRELGGNRDGLITAPVARMHQDTAQPGIAREGTWNKTGTSANELLYMWIAGPNRRCERFPAYRVIFKGTCAGSGVCQDKAFGVGSVIFESGERRWQAA